MKVKVYHIGEQMVDKWPLPLDPIRITYEEEENLKTIILTSCDKETRVTVEDDVRVRVVGQHGVVAFEQVTGRHFDETTLVAMANYVDMAYVEGTSIQVRTTVPGVPANRGEWKDV